MGYLAYMEPSYMNFSCYDDDGDEDDDQGGREDMYDPENECTIKIRRDRWVVHRRQDVSLSEIHIIYNKRKNNNENHVTFHATVIGHTKDFWLSL